MVSWAVFREQYTERNWTAARSRGQSWPDFMKTAGRAYQLVKASSQPSNEELLLAMCGKFAAEMVPDGVETVRAYLKDAAFVVRRDDRGFAIVKRHTPDTPIRFQSWQPHSPLLQGPDIVNRLIDPKQSKTRSVKAWQGTCGDPADVRPRRRTRHGAGDPGPAAVVAGFAGVPDRRRTRAARNCAAPCRSTPTS